MSTLNPLRLLLLVISIAQAGAWAQVSPPSARFALPERLRLLQGQYLDLVVEVRNATAVSNLKVTAGPVDLTAKFAAPVKAELDCDTSSDFVVWANLQSFEATGDVELTVSLTADWTTLTDKRVVSVMPFALTGGQRRNIVLFIGDAMGTAYRDAARLVSRSIVDASGKNSFREGYFDNLLEMDKITTVQNNSRTGSTCCKHGS